MPCHNSKNSVSWKIVNFLTPCTHNPPQNYVFSRRNKLETEARSHRLQEKSCSIISGTLEYIKILRICGVRGSSEGHSRSITCYCLQILWFFHEFLKGAWGDKLFSQSLHKRSSQKEFVESQTFTKNTLALSVANFAVTKIHLVTPHPKMS